LKRNLMQRFPMKMLKRSLLLKMRLIIFKQTG